MPIFDPRKQKIERIGRKQKSWIWCIERNSLSTRWGLHYGWKLGIIGAQNIGKNKCGNNWADWMQQGAQV